MSKKYGIVLAAGKGTRMKSERHKVLHPVLGRSMIDHAITSLEKVGIDQIVTVIGYEADSIKTEIGERSLYAMQAEQLGTAHAVMMAKHLLADLEGTTIVTYGDVPLLTEQTLSRLFEYHQAGKATLTILTAKTDNPTGYGRIVRDEFGNILSIVEEKDATKAEQQIKEINTGVCCYDNKILFEALKKVNKNNAQGEYYLTDLVSIIGQMGLKVTAYTNEDFEETLGINDRIQLSEAEKILRKRINKNHMRNGATLIDPDNTYIGMDVTIAADVTIYPGTVLTGKTSIGKNSVIGANSQLHHAVIGENTYINASVISHSEIGDHTTVGPYAHIRMNTEIGNGVRIGNFVEVKKSVYKDGAKSAHLSYIGDATLGENVNIGCGAITVNYDGKNKHQTIIGANTMVGCNANLIAPLIIEPNAYIAAGSTINKNVPENALAIARSKQENMAGYAAKIRE